jgi:hypothetical protein
MKTGDELMEARGSGLAKSGNLKYEGEGRKLIFVYSKNTKVFQKLSNWHF